MGLNCESKTATQDSEDKRSSVGLERTKTRRVGYKIALARRIVTRAHLGSRMSPAAVAIRSHRRSNNGTAAKPAKQPRQSTIADGRRLTSRFFSTAGSGFVHYHRDSFRQFVYHDCTVGVLDVSCQKHRVLGLMTHRPVSSVGRARDF